jgi:AcrR family transcriptional regulator
MTTFYPILERLFKFHRRAKGCQDLVMATARRPRKATEEKRARLLDATEEIMLKEGYAAVSSRSVATAVGINAPLVHYYFPTLDDLFVAVLRRRAGRNVMRMAEALASPEPLRTWWELASDPRGTALFVELMAAANHRPALRAEVGEVARQVREMQMAKLSTLLDEYGLDPEEFPPALIAATMQGLAFGVVTDQVAGYETAADEAAAAMGRLLARLEERRARRLSH